MSTVLLDTHVLYWWSSEPDRLSKRASAAVNAARDLAVSGITWFELAWMAQNERIHTPMPVRSWLDQLSRHVQTIGITPGIAALASGLPATFPSDPADRLIYATAIERGWPLVTKDERLRGHAHSRTIAVW